MSSGPSTALSNTSDPELFQTTAYPSPERASPMVSSPIEMSINSPSSPKSTEAVEPYNNAMLGIVSGNSTPHSSVYSSSRRFKPTGRGPRCELQPLTTQELSKLLLEQPEAVLLIDVRPFTMYAFTHIKSAISICIPSTLLKRQTFGFQKIMDFVAPQDVETLNRASNCSHIIFYDQITTRCGADSTLQRTAAKFLNADAVAASKLHWVVGGLAAVVQDQPHLITACDGFTEQPSDKQEDLLPNGIQGDSDGTPRLTLSSVKTVPRSPFSLLPVVTSIGASLGSPISTPTRGRPPLDESSSIHANGKVADRLREFPQWLVSAVKRTESGQNVLAEAFQRLQAAEMHRVTPGSVLREPLSARALSPRMRAITPRSSPSTPFSDLSMQSTSSTNTSPLDNYLKKQPMDKIHQRNVSESSSLNPELNSNQFIIVAGDDPRKNRYTNIAPFGFNRVLVRGSEYLNASYIRSRISPLQYIATQAPVPASFGDFWWCVYEQNVPLIVMLTTLRTESGQIKGNKYWHNNSYEGLSVNLVEESNVNFNGIASGLIMRRINLVAPDGASREVIQLQYENWPDLGCPADPNDVLELVEFKKRIMKNVDETDKVIVHCSAGCGRTGTFCAIDAVTDYLSKLTWLEAQNDPKDRVLEVVSELREQRMAMVQNQRQLLLCYEAVMLWFLRQLENTA